MQTTENTLAVANTIAQQIGHRAFLMMGTRYKMGDANSLTFDVRGDDTCNRIQVILDDDDTYTLKFFRCRGIKAELVHESHAVYADGLQQCIEYRTGLALSL